MFLEYAVPKVKLIGPEVGSGPKAEQRSLFLMTLLVGTEYKPPNWY